MHITLAELASLTRGEILAGDPALVITGFNSITEAEAGDVTFLGNTRYAPKLKQSRASALLADGTLELLPESAWQPSCVSKAAMSSFCNMTLRARHPGWM